MFNSGINNPFYNGGNNQPNQGPNPQGGGRYIPPNAGQQARQPVQPVPVINNQQQNPALVQQQAVPGQQQQNIIPVVIQNQAVNGVLAQNEVQMNNQQILDSRQAALQQDQLNAIAKALIQQNGMKTVQNDNLKWRAGLRPAGTNFQHNKKVGLVQPQQDGPQGQIQISGIEASLQDTDEREKIAMLSQMTYEERRQFLKQFDLSVRSIYDPLPDNNEVYKVNLLVSRLNSERIYTF